MCLRLIARAYSGDWFALVDAHFTAGRLAEATKQYRDKVKRPPCETDALSVAATFEYISSEYVRRGRLQDAGRALAAAATSYEKEGFNLRAMAAWKRAAGLDPTLNTREDLIRLCRHQGLKAEADALEREKGKETRH